MSNDAFIDISIPKPVTDETKDTKRAKAKATGTARRARAADLSSKPRASARSRVLDSLGISDKPKPKPKAKPKTKPAPTPMQCVFPNYSPVQATLDLEPELEADLPAPIPVRTFANDHFPPELRPFIPDINQFQHYTPDPKWLEQLAVAVDLNHRVALIGDPGTSKTSLVYYFAAHTRQPLLRLQGSEGITQDEILGTPTIRNKEVIWSPSIVEQAVINGAILLIDEVNRITPRVLIGLQSLAEQDGIFICPGHLDPSKRAIKPHPDFRLILTDNTTGTTSGNYAGAFVTAEVQDISFLSRINTTIVTSYPDPEEEFQQLVKEYALPPASHVNLRRLINFANTTRSGWQSAEYDLPFTRREMRSVLELTGYMPRLQAIELAYINKLGSEEQREAARLVYKGLFES